MDFSKQTIDIVQTVILFLTFVGAVVIGQQQIKINNTIARLEDSVDIFSYQKQGASQLMLFNVGKVQLYITAIKIDNEKKESVDNFLLPAGQQQNAWYLVNLPSSEVDQVRSIEVSLTDQLNRHWESTISALYKGNNDWEVSVHRIKEIF